MEILAKNGFFYNFWLKIQNVRSKRESLGKNRNFHQKWKLWSKIKNLGKKSKVW